MDTVKNVGAELIALAIDATAFAICLRHLLRWRTVLRDLQNAPTLALDEQLPDKVKAEPERFNYVVLRGVVRPVGEPIESESKEKATGVIKKFTMKEHVIARSTTGFWSDESRTIYEMFNAVPFFIAGNGIRVEVVDALDADVIDMDIIMDHFEPVSPSLLDHIWGYFSGVRSRGIQTTEEMLRDGTYITAIGELSGRNGDALKLQPPKNGSPLFLVTSTKNSLIKKIGDSQNILRVLVFLLGSVGIAISARIIYKYLKKKNQQNRNRILKEQLATMKRQRRELGREKNLSELQLCVVCTENPKEIILLPCGHVSLCENCSDNIQDKCPVCRMTIESKAPAFIT